MDLPKIKGRMEQAFSLKQYNTWRVGGPGRWVFWPESLEEMAVLYRFALEHNVEIRLLGRGSNVLIPDEGFLGMVIITTSLKAIRWHDCLVTVQAGYNLSALAREAAAQSLDGLAFTAGIPGTVGGAAVMNAGAYGSDMSEIVQEAAVLNTDGDWEIWRRPQMAFAYRTSACLAQGRWLGEVTLRLKQGEKEVLIKQMASYQEKRRASQPLEYPNAGSVFKNPEGMSAGKIIEEAGWKGYKIGGAQVSEKHANFIVNTGGATATDIERLIITVQEDVWQRFGVRLEPEIKRL